ncbi:MAG: hypothetical protein NWF00_10940 [Candidatus Bathyarchaeota archaeon]|nr:hypothetical protein [Candidatus Bathyarchaeota archaeon]
MRNAPLAENLECWLRSPANLDIAGIDTINVKLSPENAKHDAPVIAGLAKKRKSVELELKEPNTKEAMKKYKVVSTDSEEAKATRNSPLLGNKHLPTHAEIVERAIELWREDNPQFQFNADPTEAELREEGQNYLRTAQIELMTIEGGAAERSVMAYVGSLKAELENIGFTVVPLDAPVSGTDNPYF